MKKPYFFGYGSLVNRKTHDFTDTHPARLRGWRRVWRHTSLRPVAYLSVVPDPASEITGLIAHVPDNDWAGLDIREGAYDRVTVSDHVSHPKQDPISVAVYTVPDGHCGHSSADHTLLLSYIDVVVQGYFQQFAEAGVADFFATTSGWSTPIVNDRANPAYPRHQTLSRDETGLVDHHLKRLGISPKDAPTPTNPAPQGTPV